jgi:hypothetical protein
VSKEIGIFALGVLLGSLITGAGAYFFLYAPVGGNSVDETEYFEMPGDVGQAESARSPGDEKYDCVADPSLKMPSLEDIDKDLAGNYAGWESGALVGAAQELVRTSGKETSGWVKAAMLYRLARERAKDASEDSVAAKGLARMEEKITTAELLDIEDSCQFDLAAHGYLQRFSGFAAGGGYGGG